MKKKTIIIMSSTILFLVTIIIVLLLTGSKKITITFDTDGGSKVESIEIKKGSTTTLPKPTKENYVFNGWYINDEKINDNYEFNQDTKLLAHWKLEGEKEIFTVTFETDSEDVIDPIELKCGEELKLPEEPTKEGYTFIAWENEDMKTIRDGEKLECNDTTLTASWDKEDDLEDNSRLTISFDSRGGTSVKSIKVVCKDAVVPTLPVPTKEGYIFTSWTTRTGKVMTSGVTLGCDNTTFYANWKEDPNYFTVTFKSNGGTDVKSMKVKCNTELKLPKEPTKDGYTFVSWTDENETPILDGAKLTCENITLYANWKEQETEKKYTCPDRYELKDTNKCISTKNPESTCPKDYTYSNKASTCYKYIQEATVDENQNNTCQDNTQYKKGSDLGTDKDGCYDLKEAVDTCPSEYTLLNNKCTKTIDATLN